MKRLDTLRLVEADDAAAITAIYSPIVAGTAISFELEPPTVSQMRERIEKTLITLPWLVSIDSAAQISGYAYASQHRERPAYQWSIDTTVYIRDDSRGLGIGKRLCSALIEILKRQGYCQAFAGIALPNEGSVALHEALGFSALGVYRRVGYKLGAWRDVGWWQKTIQSPVSPGPILALPHLLAMDGGAPAIDRINHP
jgi:L-amino acid N-acyltransferase YncA